MTEHKERTLPHEFFATHTESHAYGLWKAVCRTVAQGLPRAGAERVRYLAEWDEAIGAHLAHTDRQAPRTWWARFEHVEPPSRGQYEGGGMRIFRDYLPTPNPLWPLARTMNLAFDSGYDERAFARLAHLPMGHITGLHIGQSISADTLRTALGGGQPPQLLALSVSAGCWDHAFLTGCHDLDLWQRLESLAFRYAGMGDAGLDTLLSLTEGGALRRLNLSHLPLGDAGGRTLGQWSGLQQLNYLGLDSVGLDETGLAEILGQPGPFALKELFIKKGGFRDVQLGPAMGRALGQSAMLDNLEILRIESSGLGDAGVIALLSHRGLRRLKKLVLRSSALGDDAVLALAKSESLGTLEALDIDYNYGLSPGAVDALAHGCDRAGVALRRP